ncbi:hypothetical protein [Persicobacter psychrovividus]|uniref:HNH endonuclease n=1 Tax=Persicobacter psychrovividus TaxID=387638 RepID=A0ABM7VA51_9BACT|nr:hypothetical protein PEPS_00870 [Persicobacter psychrovividus]
MQKEALKRGEAFDGQRLALYTDCYTGKPLRGGDRYDYEHIISAEELFMRYRATHTNEQIAEIVNHPDNVSVTLRSINQFKGKYDLQSRVLDNPMKIDEFGIDLNYAKKSLAKAQRAVLNF